MDLRCFASPQLIISSRSVKQRIHPRTCAFKEIEFLDRTRFDLRTELYRIFGVDLTQIPGVNTLTAHTLLAKIGPDVSRFANASAFSSWLGLCPDNRISGGKVLSVQTRIVKNRTARALRIAAQSLHRSKSYLGDFYRRMRAKMGTPKAITAAAHKLARIIFTCSQPGKNMRRRSFPNRSCSSVIAKKSGCETTLVNSGSISYLPYSPVSRGLFLRRIPKLQVRRSSDRHPS
jgi:hypothetical protein